MHLQSLQQQQEQQQQQQLQQDRQRMASQLHPGHGQASANRDLGAAADVRSHESVQSSNYIILEKYKDMGHQRLVLNSSCSFGRSAQVYGKSQNLCPNCATGASRGLPVATRKVLASPQQVHDFEVALIQDRIAVRAMVIPTADNLA